MSEGAFTPSKYEMDGGTVINVKVQPETLTVTDGTTVNDAPTGAVTLGISAYTRKPKNQYGVGCRLIRCIWTNDPPAGYKDASFTIPVLTPAAFAAYSQGDTITYLGTSATISRKITETLT